MNLLVLWKMQYSVHVQNVRYSPSVKAAARPILLMASFVGWLLSVAVIGRIHVVYWSIGSRVGGLWSRCWVMKEFNLTGDPVRLKREWCDTNRFAPKLGLGVEKVFTIEHEHSGRGGGSGRSQVVVGVPYPRAARVVEAEELETFWGCVTPLQHSFRRVSRVLSNNNNTATAWGLSPIANNYKNLRPC